jgi:MFS family permease
MGGASVVTTSNQGDAAFAKLDEAPMRAAFYGLWFAASGGPLLDGFTIFTIGVALPLIAVELAIGPLAVGLVGSALVAGAALGARLGGAGADRFGRKKAFLVDIVIIAVGALLSALARDATMLLAGQFLVGVGIGIDFPVSGSYVAELMPRRTRSRMVVATIALQSVGMVGLVRK